MQRARILRVAALDAQGALFKNQVPVRDFQNVEQRRFGRRNIGVKPAARPFHRVNNAMAHKVLHDFSQKMMWDVKALREFLQAYFFAAVPVNRHKSGGTQRISECFGEHETKIKRHESPKWLTTIRPCDDNAHLPALSAADTFVKKRGETL